MEELDARANDLLAQGAGNSGGGERRADRARQFSRANLNAWANGLPTTGADRVWRAPRAEPRPKDGNRDGSAETDRAMRQLRAHMEELEERLADAEADTNRRDDYSAIPSYFLTNICYLYY